MSRRLISRYMTEEEYLMAEEKASVRNEYVDGHVFAMTGASEAHNLICTNLLVAIHSHLQNGPCRVYSNDMKVRIESAKSFYYPDIIVTCEPFDAKSVYKVEPVLLIEVLSPSTATTDKREKLVAYKKIAFLQEYIIVYQDRQKIELWRRSSTSEWETDSLTGAVDLSLESLPAGILSIPLSQIYKGYNPPSRVKEDDEAVYQVGPRS